jgi:tRNA (cmo5U34)-methyltransferase
MPKFTQHWASDYDMRIVRLIPGYDSVHELVSCVLAAHLQGAPGPVDILVAGAGTGRELDELAARDPAWRFTAVDNSQAMLDNARARATAGGYLDRVGFQTVNVEAYSASAPHAAALAVMVMHFIRDDAGRLEFLRTFTRSLPPGAPLVMCDYADATQAFHPAYRQWAHAQGHDEGGVKVMFQRLAANFHPINEAHLGRLLAEAGFAAPTRIFQALGYSGYVTLRL